jgi:hypothetical protein
MITPQRTVKTPYINTSKTTLTGIVGLKRGLLELLSSSRTSAESGSTEPISVRALADAVGASLRTVETTLARMVREGLISVAQSKRGRGGWVSYTIEAGLLQALDSAQAQGLIPPPGGRPNGLEGVGARFEGPGVGGWSPGASGRRFVAGAPRARMTHGSAEIPDDWLEVDCHLLHQEQVMFGPSHIRQVWKWGNVSLDELRLSVEAFAFDIRVNRKTLRMGLLNGFMEILKSGPYGPPANFETQADSIRRQNIERLEAYRARQKDLDRRESDLAFSIWINGMSEARLRQWLPAELQEHPLESHAVVSTLRLVYQQGLGRGVARM